MPIEHACNQVSRLLGQLRLATVVPNGTRKAIAAAVDALRYSGAPEDRVNTAGDLSVVIHKLELALCRGDIVRQQAARDRLEDIDNRWSQLPVIQMA